MHCSYCSNIYNLTNSQFSSFLERARSKLLGEEILVSVKRSESVQKIEY